MCEICKKDPCDFRCPNNTKTKVIGKCSNCETELTDEYEIWTDNEDNLFCTQKCGIEFHEIKEIN